MGQFFANEGLSGGGRLLAESLSRLFGGTCAPAFAMYRPDEMLTDEELFADLMAGRKEAADALIERHGGALFAYLRRMVRSRETAEDLFQETWIRAVQKCAQFDGKSNARPWLYRIALNLVRDHVRHETAARRGGGVEHLPLEPEIMAAAPTTGNDAIQRSELDALHSAVGLLPMKFREVLALRYFEDMPIEEIASVIRRPKGTVKSRLARGLKMLQAQMETGQ
jgi:RNA polymerase sigma-70 factor (ECF subfamily)